jgi:hypothetical protein
MRVSWAWFALWSCGGATTAPGTGMTGVVADADTDTDVDADSDADTDTDTLVLPDPFQGLDERCATTYAPMNFTVYYVGQLTLEGDLAQGTETMVFFPSEPLVDACSLPASCVVVWCVVWGVVGCVVCGVGCGVRCVWCMV